MKKNISAETKEQLEDLLASCVKHFDMEDRIVREYQLRKIRRLKLYWNSFSQIYWSDVAKDYRVFGADNINNDSQDQAYYDKPVNVFRALLETIIAALSIQIPSPHCVPDDADNPNDITTAKAGNVIGELLYKHNDVLFLWLYALYVHCTEGLVACYSYTKEDKAFGEYGEAQYKDEETEAFQCPNCGSIIPDEAMAAMQQQMQQQAGMEEQPGMQQDPNQIGMPQEMSPEGMPPEQPQFTEEDAEIISSDEMNEYQPDDDDIELHAMIEDEGPVCPDCAVALDSQLQKSKVIIPRFVGMINKPKGRVCFKVKGGMYVKIAVYAKEQCETPYLIESYETHYSNAMEMYPKMREHIPQGGWGNIGVNEPYEWYARLNPQYRNAFPEEVVTVKNSWLRPAAFNILTEEESKLMHKHFPDGARVVMINDFVAEYENESLDDCWTLTRNPMFDYLTHEPLGELVVNVQDIINDLISLSIQTIEHGITQTWADPAAVDFESYKQIEASPGTITPIKTGAAAGKSIGDFFYSTSTAQLSPEVFQFYQIVQQLGQFVSGAMPSIYGGQQSGGSKTASEYSMARTNALQRLSTPWRMFTIWWKDIFGKAIPAYMKLVHEDEKFVKKDPNGNFVNVWVRKADLAGKIGSVEVESTEQIPVSDDQKADIVMKLIELNNAEILQALTSPENLPFIRKIIKIPEFRLPGEDDRTKQYEEINELVNSVPIVQQPDPIEADVAANAGMPLEPQELPSVEVDPLVDNHMIEADICRGWLISDAGRLCKIENPEGYKNVLLHFKQHMQVLAQQQIQQQAQVQQQQTNNAPPKKPGGKAPEEKQISEVNDARSPIQ